MVLVLAVAEIAWLADAVAVAVVAEAVAVVGIAPAVGKLEASTDALVHACKPVAFAIAEVANAVRSIAELDLAYHEGYIRTDCEHKHSH